MKFIILSKELYNFQMLGIQVGDDIRRCLTNRFPYGIIYYEKDDEIIILAVMQLNRKPDYWKDRQSLCEDDNKYEEANEKP